MDYRRWLWLVLALGLIALGVAIALVTRMPLKDKGEAPTEAERATKKRHCPRASIKKEGEASPPA